MPEDGSAPHILLTGIGRGAFVYMRLCECSGMPALLPIPAA